MRNNTPKPRIPPIPPISPGPKIPDIPTPKSKKLKNRLRSAPSISRNTVPAAAKRAHVKKQAGTCYKNPNCEGGVLLRNSSKQECRARGGKSWKGATGCQNI